MQPQSGYAAVEELMGYFPVRLKQEYEATASAGSP